MGNKKAEKKLGLLQRFVAVLGTGLITGGPMMIRRQSRPTQSRVRSLEVFAD